MTPFSAGRLGFLQLGRRAKLIAVHSGSRRGSPALLQAIESRFRSVCEHLSDGHYAVLALRARLHVRSAPRLAVVGYTTNVLLVKCRSSLSIYVTGVPG